MEELYYPYSLNDINYNFIEFMHKYLYNNSIITVPTILHMNIADCDDERLHKFVKEDEDSGGWPGSRFEWTHEHCMVGATSEGHIVGWHCMVAQT